MIIKFQQVSEQQGMLLFNRQHGMCLDNKTLQLAQSVEHETLNLRVVGSSPTLGDKLFDSQFLQRNTCSKQPSLQTCKKISKSFQTLVIRRHGLVG